MEKIKKRRNFKTRKNSEQIQNVTSINTITQSRKLQHTIFFLLFNLFKQRD